MKFIVDELPYYGDECPFSLWGHDLCPRKRDESECPRYWDKYFISSTNNPHQCYHLIEYEQYLKENAAEK